MQVMQGLKAAVNRRNLIARNGDLADAGTATDPVDAGVGADAGVVTIGDHRVPTDPMVLRRQMEQLVHERGRGGPTEYLGELETALLPDLPIAGPIEDEGVGRAHDALQTVRDVVEAINFEIDDLIASFTAQGRVVLNEVLKDSETRAKAEGIKYGLTEETIEELVCVDPESGAIDTETWTRYDMPDSPAGRGVAAAAAQLLKRRSERIDPLKRAVYELHVRWGRGAAPSGGPYLPLKPPELVALEAQIKEEEQEYDGLAAELAGRYPILGSFTKDKHDTSGLHKLAAGPSQGAAQLIGTQIAETLRKINTVREENAPDGDVNVYKLGQIVALTKAQQSIADGSWQEKVIDECVDIATDTNVIMDIALALINLALVALAPATGGASLIVAAGLSTATAVAHAQAYMLEDAMAGSDVDKARALSQEDPSLFWLAVDIVGAIGDVGAGAAAAAKLAGVWRSAAPAVRAAKGARTVEEINTARSQLAHALEHEPAVLARISKSLDEDGRLAAASKEIEAVEQAADVSVAELKAGRQADTASGHVHVTKHGRVFSCASPCTEMRARYSEVLASDEGNHMLERLRNIEEEAAKLKPSDEAGLEALAKRAAMLDDDLAEMALRARSHKIAAWLQTQADIYPALKETPLSSEAIARIIKKTNADHIKGQLLEELAGAKVEKMLATGDRTALEKLAGERASATLEYIAGHRIKDASGEPFTDGMLIIRDGDKVEIVAIFESKAGGASSRALGSKWSALKRDGTYKSLTEIEAGREFEKLSEPEREIWEARADAIVELKHRKPKQYEKPTIRQIDAAADAQGDIARVMDKTVKTEAGQAVQDIERAVSVGVKIDGELVKRVRTGMKSTKVVGVLPTDVNAAAIEAKIGSASPKGQGLNFGTMNVGMTARDIRSLADEIAERAKAPTL